MTKTTLLVLMCVMVTPSCRVLGSTGIIIDVESQGTNVVYTLTDRQRPLEEIESELRKFVEVLAEQAKELTVYIRARGQVSPEALLPVFAMLKRVGWHKGEFLISTEDKDIFSGVRIPFDAQRIRTDRFNKRLDPFAVYRDLQLAETNGVPNKALEHSADPAEHSVD